MIGTVLGVVGVVVDCVFCGWAALVFPFGLAVSTGRLAGSFLAVRVELIFRGGRSRLCGLYGLVCLALFNGMEVEVEVGS